jgi:hypothetical protein
MTSDEIVEAVKALGSADDIDSRRKKLSRRETLLNRISFGAVAVGFPGFFVVVSNTVMHLPGYALYVALDFISLFGGMFLGMFSSMCMPGPADFTPLTELKQTRAALELIEKSAQAQAVRDAVIKQGRTLVGRDFYLMRALWQEEEASKTEEYKQAEEIALSRRLHTR